MPSLTKLVAEYGVEAVRWMRDFGLVSIGGSLDTARLLDAYRHGIFPWYGEGEPVLWWSPKQRAIFDLDRFHVSRRLLRTYRSGKFTFTVNKDFAAVIQGCADRPPDQVWITADMIRAYTQLHREGHAHSIESWQGADLAGGIYGVAVGGLFAGESMFHRKRDGSKVALVYLVERLRERGFRLFDTQMLTDHTALFGAVEISRDEYLQRLSQALTRDAKFADT